MTDAWLRLFEADLAERVSSRHARPPWSRRPRSNRPDGSGLTAPSPSRPSYGPGRADGAPNEAGSTSPHRSQLVLTAFELGPRARLSWSDGGGRRCASAPPVCPSLASFRAGHGPPGPGATRSSRRAPKAPSPALMAPSPALMAPSRQPSCARRLNGPAEGHVMHQAAQIALDQRRPSPRVHQVADGRSVHSPRDSGGAVGINASELAPVAQPCRPPARISVRVSAHE